MKSYSPLAVLALAAAVSAQSAPGFPVQVNTELAVDFQSSSESFIDPGQKLSLDDVQDAPTVSGPQGSTRTLTFMLFMIDQDVKSDDGSRVQLLHYFQPNLAGASEVLSDFSTDAENATTARIGFDMAGFAQAANLPEPVGANWFQVQNGEAAPSSTTTSSEKTSASSTTVTETASTESSTETVVTTSSETVASTTATETATAFGSAIFTITTSSSTETAEATTTTATTTGGASQATASASETASVTPDGSNAASSVDVRNSLAGLILGLSLSIVGMWF
ncbi:hypothetical protein LTR40_004583 [Exophiala xenobiotica]|nr:hypothetical protein LTR40_004583 [Exophiala xenobiotica]